MMLPFDLPPLPGCRSRPLWQGRGFVAGGKLLPVLEYSTNFAGWSDDLTALHEDAAGDSHPIDLASRENALAELRRHADGAADPTILEIGCSSGFLLEAIARAFPAAVLIGADIVKAPLFRLAERMPETPLLRFDLLQCPLPPEIFDVIIILNVLEHIDDDVAAMRELTRLLKPGGVVIVEVPAGPGLYDAYDAALRHFRRYSMAELTRKFASAGLRVVHRSHLGFVIYPAFCIAKWRSRRQRDKGKAAEQIVRDSAARTASSWIVRWAFAVEALLGKLFRFPWGVRCLLVVEKEEASSARS